MTTDVTDRPQTDKPLERWASNVDPLQVIVIAVLALLAFFVLFVARNQVVRPLDNLATEQQCRSYGETIEQPLTGWERSNRFGLLNRSEGFCSYGPGLEAEASGELTLAIADTEPSPLYTLGKFIGIALQFGILSIFLRLTVDPVLDLYSAVRPRSR